MLSTPRDTNFGELVRATRDERHLTQTEAAAEIGVALRTLQHWEAGMRPQPRHRRAILAWIKSAAEAAA